MNVTIIGVAKKQSKINVCAVVICKTVGARIAILAQTVFRGRITNALATVSANAVNPNKIVSKNVAAV